MMIKKELISYICYDIVDLVEEVLKQDGNNLKYSINCTSTESLPQCVTVDISGTDNIIYIYLSLDKYKGYGKMLKDVLAGLRGHLIFDKYDLYPFINNMRYRFRIMIESQRLNLDEFNKKYIYKNRAVCYSDELLLSNELTDRYITQQMDMKTYLLRGMKIDSISLITYLKSKK